MTDTMPSSEPHGLHALTRDGSAKRQREVAAEVPVAISVSGFGYAVMMATPANLEDFAYGFALSERLIDTSAQVERIELRTEPRGVLLDLWLDDSRQSLVLERVRHRIGESSCGLCGIENLDQALRALPALLAPDAVAPDAIFAALSDLPNHQPLSNATGAVHAAALADATGRIVAAREDVGRHNAFDKLIGHALRHRLALDTGFVLLSSRCSYELVEKAALAGVRLLVTVSAPTTLAIERAREAGLTLIALARSDEMLVAADPHGVFSA